MVHCDPSLWRERPVLNPFETTPGSRKSAANLERVDRTVQFQWIDAFAMGDQAAGDRDFSGRAIWLDAERNRRKPENHAFDERIAHAAPSFDAPADRNIANGLADLDTYCTVGMRDDTCWKSADRTVPA